MDPFSPPCVKQLAGTFAITIAVVKIVLFSSEVVPKQISTKEQLCPPRLKVGQVDKGKKFTFNLYNLRLHWDPKALYDNFSHVLRSTVPSYHNKTM